MGLAPGESVVTDVRQIELSTYTTIVRIAFESSETPSFTGPAAEVDDGPRSTIFFKPCVITGYGSFSWGAIGGAFVGAMAGGPLGAAVGAFVGGAAQEFFSGGSGDVQVADA